MPVPPARRCPSEETALRYLAGESRDQAEAIERHVDGCPECRALFAHLARTSLGISRVTDGEGAEVELGDYLPAETTVGRYEILSRIGRGGMGVVYEAADPELGRTVALKVLHGGLDAAAAPRLLAEARAMARLSHPHVCTVFDVGLVGDRAYLAMERVHGGTLDAWLGEGARTIREIVDAFAAAGRGLAAAHELGIVHRDFKPTNVLVTDEGRVLVADFGLAATAHEPTLPVGGTPRYMAPEQREGSIDPRVDQYAFGVALDEALRSRPISRPLRAVVARASAEEPSRRFPSMAVLVDALERAARPRRWSRVAAVAVVAATAAGVASASRRPLEPPSIAVEAAAEPPAVHPEVDALLAVCRAYHQASDPEGALVIHDLTVREAEALDDPAGLALALAARAAEYGKVGRTREAIDELERAFLLATEIHRDDIAADAAIIRTGLLAGDLERPGQALAWARHAETALGRMEDLEPRIRASFDEVVGMAHEAAGEPDEALVRYDRAIDRLRAESPTLDLHLIRPLAARAHVELERGDIVDGRRDLQQATAIAERVYGPRHPEVGGLLANLARVASDVGDDEAALEHLDRARSIVAAAYSQSHPNVLAIDASIGALWLNLGRFEDTVALMQDALGRAPEGHPSACGIAERLAVALRHLDRCEEARPRFREALDCAIEVFGPESEAAARTRRQMAYCDPTRPGSGT